MRTPLACLFDYLKSCAWRANTNSFEEGINNGRKNWGNGGDPQTPGRGVPLHPFGREAWGRPPNPRQGSTPAPLWERSMGEDPRSPSRGRALYPIWER